MLVWRWMWRYWRRRWMWRWHMLWGRWQLWDGGGKGGLEVVMAVWEMGAHYQMGGTLHMLSAWRVGTARLRVATTTRWSEWLRGSVVESGRGGREEMPRAAARASRVVLR